MSSGNASTIFNAVEKACPTLDSLGLINLARELRFVILHDCPDAAQTNLRKQLETAARGSRNLLYIPGVNRLKGRACIGERLVSEAQLN